ncbi:MAG: acyl-CoA dehydratase activase-related protein [Peptococcia bacterium]
MKVGIPKGLLYCRYYPFFEHFFTRLGAEVISSPDTNKQIFNLGVKYCVDEACLPIKIFHGHVAYIKDECDLLLVPRIMRIKEKEFICPKFCGLPEMVKNSIPDMPPVTTAPIYASSKDKLLKWAEETGRLVTTSRTKIQQAFNLAWLAQLEHSTGIDDKNRFPLKIALVGHPYCIYDSYINMNIIQKLHQAKIGLISEEAVSEKDIDLEVQALYKKPFWTFARNSYGFAAHVAKTKKCHGIIYISSFACGIDSVVIELIKESIGDFPLLVLKIDEHTGEAGLDTRVEAFIEMLERSVYLENNIPTYG